MQKACHMLCHVSLVCYFRICFILYTKVHKCTINPEVIKLL